MNPLSLIAEAEKSLRVYCETTDFKGWDPWDALASPLLKIFPFSHKYPRWAANHLIKISPLNFRPLLGIRPDCFAKGLALFLASYVSSEKGKPAESNWESINELKQRLFDKTITGYDGPCWGTNVAYQTRAFFVPENTPSLVHTAFAVEAILDLYDLKPDPTLLETADGACRFILSDLNIRETNSGISFSYTPTDHSRVINVSALAARMLVRTGKMTENHAYVDTGRRAAKFVITQQNRDGSWYYGQDPVHRWIDGYHTGFVLEALEDYFKYTGDNDAINVILHGLNFYRTNLFGSDGTPKFSPKATYPIDGHCLAQGILTFTRLRQRHPESLEMAQKIALWGIRHFQDARGYFYFQRRRLWLNKIPHIRWVQAWMFLALNRLLNALQFDQ
jgi:hypothetical protein